MRRRKRQQHVPHRGAAPYGDDFESLGAGLGRRAKAGKGRVQPGQFADLIRRRAACGRQPGVERQRRVGETGEVPERIALHGVRGRTRQGIDAGGAHGGQFVGERPDLTRHDRPVQRFGHPSPPRRAHPSAQIPRSRQRRQGLGRLPDMHRRMLGHRAHIGLIGGLLDGVPLDKMRAYAPAGRPPLGGNQDALDPVAHGRAVAVPVADHDRQARGHRLDRRDAEGLLDIVDQRQEDVGGGPQVFQARAVVAVDEAHLDVGGVPARGLLVELPVLLAGKPAGQGEGDSPASRRLRDLHRLEHRLRKGLLEVGQPPHPQNQHVVFGHAEPVAAPRPRLGPVRQLGETARIDAQGNHRQPRPRRRRAAGSRRKMLAPSGEHRLQGVADAGRGADQRVPVVHRRHLGHGDHLAHRRRCDGVDQSHEAVGAISRPAPAHPG